MFSSYLPCSRTQERPRVQFPILAAATTETNAPGFNGDGFDLLLCWLRPGHLNVELQQLSISHHGQFLYGHHGFPDFSRNGRVPCS